VKIAQRFSVGPRTPKQEKSRRDGPNVSGISAVLRDLSLNVAAPNAEALGYSRMSLGTGTSPREGF